MEGLNDMSLLERSASEELSEIISSSSTQSPKVTRSVSVCEANQLPSSQPEQQGGRDGRYPPVLVLSHPTMRKMAIRLVQATSSRILKLKLQSTVRMTRLRLMTVPY